jgi:hypothetical protein
MKLKAAAAAALVTVAAPAWAGPPFDTDDPEPTDTGHWEIYNFAAGARADGAFEGSGGFDLNYGAWKGVQLTATLPLDFVRGPGRRTNIGDVELGVKYRFFRNEKAGLQVSIFPRIILPTSGKTYGSGKAALLLPVWGQKDLGKWSLFGGGGYVVNPGAGNRGYWQTGFALTREVSPRLSLGAEATYHGRDAEDAKPTATLGVGGIWRIKGPVSLLASAGPSFAGRHGDRYHAYIALGLSF